MKLKTLTLVDTHEFMRWGMKKYGMTNEEWHEKIWDGKNGLCDYISNFPPYVTFSKTNNPTTLLGEHVNEFLKDFPELNDSVSFIFTN